MPERFQASRSRRSLRWVSVAATLGCVLLSTPGCVGIEAIAGAFGGGEAAEAPIEQGYFGLADRRVAVVASLDPVLTRRQPELGPGLEALLADRIARHVAGVRVVPPDRVEAWRRSNPYWETAPAGRVTEGLAVDRVVRVEVAEFRTREPGNAAVLDGLLDTGLQVFEAGLPDPDRPAFADRVRVRFPEEPGLGIPRLGDGGDPGPGGIATPGGPDETAIGRALLATWVRRAGPRFYDEKEARKRDERRAKERS